MCLRLGYPHPDYLLEYLTAEQLAEWEAFDLIQPIGDWREDYRTGLITSMVTNLTRMIHSKKGHNPKLTEPLDFIPAWGGRSKEKETEVQSMEEQKSFLLAFASAHNKSVKDKPKKDKPKKCK